jgi:hypothetical protein
MTEASPWLGSLPDPARVAVHDAHTALAYYNTAAGRFSRTVALVRAVWTADRPLPIIAP